MNFPTKPTGGKAYGSIPHIIGSRLGPGDYSIGENESRICTAKASRDYEVFCQTKVDGSCVAVYRSEDGELIPLIRAGYPALSSKHEQHHMFHDWVMRQKSRFDFLQPGERLAGEWLALAHGTLYDLTDREPFVPFDILSGTERKLFQEFLERVFPRFQLPDWTTGPVDPETAMQILDHYGAEEPEGVVYRVQRTKYGSSGPYTILAFVAKWVHANKVDGKYFDRDRWNYHHWSHI